MVLCKHSVISSESRTRSPTVNILKLLTLFFFLFSNEMLVSRAGIHKMLVKIANREDPDLTASSEAI